MKDLSPIVEKIIKFEKDHNMTDSDLAFASHISVEHIHAIKAGIGHIEPEVLNDLQNFFAAN
ncbi:MAG: LBP_cg2779 family protein [Bombilactobacillus mellifer]|nr:LBP_cg2779 family protein [Bombilactobacillus mellifer]